jgi:hypothetical protein
MKQRLLSYRTPPCHRSFRHCSLNAFQALNVGLQCSGAPQYVGTGEGGRRWGVGQGFGASGGSTATWPEGTHTNNSAKLRQKTLPCCVQRNCRGPGPGGVPRARSPRGGRDQRGGGRGAHQ